MFSARRYNVVNSIHSQEPEVKHTFKTRLFKMTATASAFAVVVVTILFEQSAYVERMLHFFAPSDIPKLQGVQAKPNLVRVGDVLTITVGIDRPAPKNGVTVNLSSTDPSDLTVDGTATVYQGETTGTAYSRVVAVPGYLSPIAIVATLNGDTTRTLVNVTGQRGGSDRGTQPPILHSVPVNQNKRGQNNASLEDHASLPEQKPPSAPAPLNPELLSRLEEAQGRLSAELGYWETMRRQMPPGTSLRPEITSQIYAAKSASQRCSDEVKTSDAASLGPCVDSLNDHLNQLKLQH
jgi:hypothetical protein